MFEIEETPVLFGPSGSTFGVVTHPTDGPSLPAVVILGAGIIHRVGPARASVRLARRLAAIGYRVLRFDLSGIGDSPPDPQAPDLEESVLSDIDSAISVALGEEASGVVLVGFCSGADNAFHVAADDGRVLGAVLFDPSLPQTIGFHKRDAVRRLKSGTAWLNVISGRSFLLRMKGDLSSEGSKPPDFYGLLTTPKEYYGERVAKGLARNIQYLYLFSGGVASYVNSAEQVRECLQTVFRPDRITVFFKPELKHTLGRLSDQAWFEETVLGWLEERWGEANACPRRLSDDATRSEPGGIASPGRR